MSANLFLQWLQGNDAVEAPPSYFARNQAVGGPSRSRSIREAETISPTTPSVENGPMPSAPFLSDFLSRNRQTEQQIQDEEEDDEDYEYYSDSDDDYYDENEDMVPPLPPMPMHHAANGSMVNVVSSNNNNAGYMQPAVTTSVPATRPNPPFSHEDEWLLQQQNQQSHGHAAMGDAASPARLDPTFLPPPYEPGNVNHYGSTTPQPHHQSLPSPAAANGAVLASSEGGIPGAFALSVSTDAHHHQHQQQQQLQNGNAASPRRQKSRLQRHPSSVAPEGRRIRKSKPEATEKKVPKALKDPKVREQLLALKQHKPYFLWIVTAIQIVVLIVEFGKNVVATGQLIETNPFNYMIGPSFEPLVVLGGRWVPCMKDVGFTEYYCQDGYSTDLADGNCTLSNLCGIESFQPHKQNQWYRFILPIFLHGGIVHLVMNLMFQIRTGWQMERDWGFIRMFMIYMLSGTYGFIFGANFSPQMQVSVGCSGSLYGLFACLVLDLLMNWRLIENPVKEFLWMIPSLIFSFGVGYIPLIDNFAHVGGFICGIFAGLLFMPTIHYGRWDRIIKIVVRLLCIPILIVMFSVTLNAFYQGNAAQACPWCKYLSCAPVFGRVC